jgi:DNA replication protein DnaC
VFRHGVPVRFIEFTHLLSDIREGIGRGDPAATTLTPFIHPPVLVVDELGKGRNTEWEVSILDEIVSRRYNARGALFGTTNFKPKPPPGADPNRPRTHGDGVPLASMYLSERLGERAFSRLLETVTFVPALGDDHRLRLAANSRR